jgi:hypothetical protein
MAHEEVPNARDPRPDLPSQVSIAVTVVRTERGRRLKELCARLVSAPRSLSAVVALAAATLAAAALLHSSRTNAVTRTATAKQRAATRTVAAAFGYPQRCLSIAISAADPDYASAHIDRRGGCANYRGYVNASFHRVDGVWRLVLDEGQLFVPNRLLTPARERFDGAGAVPEYPLGCVSVADALHDPRVARADVDRRLVCIRHGT